MNTTNQVQVVLVKDKDCKHSVRFSTSNPEAPVSSVYVSRKVVWVGNVTQVVVTIAQHDVQAQAQAQAQA